jgi:DNA-binding HxlR family transcriptional regulator
VNVPGAHRDRQTDRQEGPVRLGDLRDPVDRRPRLRHDALRGRWTTLIIRELLRADSYAYSELAATMPELSGKVLSERLAHLAAAGVVLRTRKPGWPPTVTYELNPHGKELGPALQALWDWGARMPAPPTAEEADLT